MGQGSTKTEGESDEGIGMIHERQANVTKLISRMNSKTEIPLPTLQPKKKTKRSSRRTRLRDVEQTGQKYISKPTYTVPDRVEKPNAIDLMKSCSAPADVEKDSINEIIDLIVEKSHRRDETLNKPICTLKKRSISFHGTEHKKRKSWKIFRWQKCYEFEDLTQEGEVYKDKETDKRRIDTNGNVIEISSKDRLMMQALEENKHDDQTRQFRTIERISPGEEGDKYKSPYTVTPKLDPLIKNTVSKLMASDQYSPTRKKQELFFMKPVESQTAETEKNHEILFMEQVEPSLQTEEKVRLDVGSPQIQSNHNNLLIIEEPVKESDRTKNSDSLVPDMDLDLIPEKPKIKEHSLNYKTTKPCCLYLLRIIIVMIALLHHQVLLLSSHIKQTENTEFLGLCPDFKVFGKS